MRVVTLSPPQLEQACASLAGKATTLLGNSPDAVIGIRSGGVAIAQSLARLTGARHLAYATASRPGSNRRKRLSPLLRLLPQRLNDGLRTLESRLLRRRHSVGRNIALDPSPFLDSLPADARPTLLVVDDAVDSGATLSGVVELLRSRLPNAAIFTAAIAVTTPTPLLSPDISLYADTLVRFPWSSDYRPSKQANVGAAASSPQLVNPAAPNQSTPLPPRPAIAIDLDGTLCRRNTFNLFLSQLLRSSASQPLSFVRLSAWMLLRKLRLTSHAGMKRRILALACPLSPTLLRSVADDVCRYANPEVANLLEQARAEGYVSILATAAPEAYASEVARRYGFDHCLATPTPSNGEEWAEMRGERKRNAVLAVCADHNLTLSIAVSDHADDTPLLSAARRPLLVDKNVGNLVEFS